jgi:hypothetical protein
MEGATVDVDTTITDLCDYIQSNTAFTYNGQELLLAPSLMVDGVEYYGDEYYGVQCGPKVSI